MTPGRPAKPATTPERRSYTSAAVEVILIVIGLAVLFFTVPHEIRSDGVERFWAMSQLLTNGWLSDMKYSMVGPLFSAPLWWLGQVYKSSQWWCARYNVFVFALGLLAMYWMLKRRLGGAVARKFALVLIFGSMFPRHLEDYFGDVFTAMLVGAGVLAVTVGYWFWGWCGIVLGVANSPATVAGLACVVAARCWQTRRWRYLALLPVTAGIVLAENWIRRGGPFVSGYAGDRGPITVLPYSGRPGFSYPFFFGLISILFSFGKGLVWFAPGLLLPIRRRLSTMKGNLYPAYRLWIWFLIGLILVHSKWYGWHGGAFWGPRSFLFVSIPASFALAVWLSTPRKGAVSSLVALVVLGWSLWVGVNGAVYDLHGLDICWANDYALEALSWHVPEFSVLFRPFVVSKTLSAEDFTIIGYCAIVFICLAMPLLDALLRRMVAAGQGWRRACASVRQWRF